MEGGWRGEGPFEGVGDERDNDIFALGEGGEGASRKECLIGAVGCYCMERVG